MNPADPGRRKAAHFVDTLRALAAEIEEFLNDDFLTYLWSDEFAYLEDLVGAANAYADLLSHDDLAEAVNHWIAEARAELQQYRDELAEEEGGP